MEAALRTLIKNATGVQNVQWTALPDHSNLPAVVLNIVSAPIEYTMSGQQELKRATVQLDIWTADHASGLPIRNAVRSINPIINGPEIKNVLLETMRQGSDTANPSKPLYRQSIDLRVFYV